MALNTVYDVPGKVRIRTALVSVSDKTGLEDLFTGLFQVNPLLRVYSTGGSLSVLQKAFPDRKSSILPVEDLTGNPEIQGGLVKTLDYKIYLGLLTEPFNESHQSSMRENGVEDIDLVVVNLYPFAQVAAAADNDLEKSRANIDIGGPTMVRAAAKNFHRVAVLCRPADYRKFLSDVQNQDGALTLDQRLTLAKTAFRHISEYDAAIDTYLEGAGTQALAVYSEREEIYG